MNQILVCIVLASACFVDIHAIRCYQCTYLSPKLEEGLSAFPGVENFNLGDAVSVEACQDPFDTETTAVTEAECDGTCAKTYAEKDGETLAVARACFPKNPQLDCQGSKCNSASGVSSCIHCCGTDLCNGAGSVTFNLMITTAMLFFALLLSRAPL